MSKAYFISGIDTEIGKTVVSAILTEALNADYWKPIQAGDLDNSDTMKVQKLVSNNNTQFHPEGYRLNHPMSPHAAADLDNVSIQLDDFQIPKTENTLLIEGAGGLFVPINDKDCIIDLIKSLNVPVILVSKNYLGSINHTLLSIHALKSKDIPIAGIIFNGEETLTTQSVIEKMTGVKIFGRVDLMDKVSRENVLKQARKFKNILN